MVKNTHVKTPYLKRRASEKLLVIAYFLQVNWAPWTKAFMWLRTTNITARHADDSFLCLEHTRQGKPVNLAPFLVRYFSPSADLSKRDALVEVVNVATRERLF
ncbi:hypothetical protein PC128_g17848 [Phytophthora cactorum]|nr:hypothetical protein PC128_g17848 [Phytophthora cactorum]